MRIIEAIDELKSFKIGSISIGNFDGLHLGHRAIVQKLVHSPHSLLISFAPYPREILCPYSSRGGILTTQDEKIKILEQLKVDNLLILKFNKKLANMSARDFIEHLIVKHAHPKKIIIGYNHRFGKGGKGDFELLILMGANLGFRVIRVPPVYVDGFPVSSSWIRDEITAGRVEKGAKLLGRLYSISAEVVSGQRRGYTLGYPTANLKVPTRKIIPRDGVYAVWIWLKTQRFKGMMSIGGSPTFKKQFALEVHIFDFNKDLLHKEIKVEFVKYIRDNYDFKDASLLKSQLQQDEKLVRKLL